MFLIQNLNVKNDLSIFELHDEIDANQATNDGIIEESLSESDSGDSGFEASLLNNVRFFISFYLYGLYPSGQD